MLSKKKKLLAGLLAALALVLSPAPAARALDSLTYLYGGTTAVYLARMEKTADSLNIVAPDYFETSPSGAVVRTKAPDPLLIAAMHDRGVAVTPFLSNHWNRPQARAMLQRAAEAAAVLAGEVDAFDLDGIDVDIQNINEADRADFTAFIRALRAALPAGKTLTVCVAANPWAISTGWQGGYDYAALSGSCDHVFIMTYDESYDGGPPGPVASFDFIRRSIEYGLRHVPREKLMIGIPFYGRFWTQGVSGAAWTIADIEWLVSNTGAAVWYDDKNECARATITVAPGQAVTTWGGRRVSPGVYDVWYENARSFEKKLALVREYGLKGVGSWALGQEPAYVWDNYAAWLYGLPFDDIRGHWAQSYIVDLAGRGLLEGRSGRTFDPEGALTRAEAAALLARLAGLSPEPDANTFSDTGSHWAGGYIAAARRAELVTGVSDTVFEPDRDVTREEFAVLAARYTNLSGAFDSTESPFGDVSRAGNPWSADAIVMLSLNNVLSGYPDGSFRPGDSVTRAEAAKVAALLETLPTRFVNGQILPLHKLPMGPR